MFDINITAYVKMQKSELYYRIAEKILFQISILLPILF